MDAFKERVLPFVKEHFLALLIAFVGVVFLAYGFASLYYERPVEEDITFSPKETASDQEEKTRKTIVVDVSGAVKNPGVYSLPEKSRVQDAILEAGGLAATVDQQRVAQMLNLAAPLIDGAKLYIPVAGEQMTTSGAVSGNSFEATAVAGASTQLININTASHTELESLPGIGEVTAGKIIENRPYGTIEELLEKKAVGQATFEKIKDQVRVY